jgi:putative hydrolase of the HAD superfamily
MFKVILVDADGVVIKRRKYFSEIYAEQAGLDAKADFLPFFQGEFRNTVVGMADLKEIIGPWLEKWKWDEGIEAFLQLWFETESNVQNDVLDYLAQLRKSGIKCYLASQQEHYRGEYILNQLGLKAKFDGTFMTNDLGVRKDDSHFFELILVQLKIPASEILFVDDEQENLDAAKAAGISTYFYRDLGEFRKFMSVA